jgi:replicative DNA helicase Mcm
MDYDDLLKRFTSFVNKEIYTDILTASTSNGVFVLDSDILESYDSELFDYFLDNPRECLTILKDITDNLDLGDFDGTISFRLTNVPEMYKVSISDLRSVHLDKFITLSGIIKQVSEVRPEITFTIWECNQCGNRMSIIQDEDTLIKPSECDCGNKKGFILYSRRLTDVQKIIVEEPQDNLSNGKQSRKINVYLSDDLVDESFQKSITPGNRVNVSGILCDKAIKTDRGRESKRRDIFLDCNYIEVVEKEFSDIELTDVDIKDIKRLAQNKKIYDYLVGSIAPSIFGYDKIKLSIGLQLFSGVHKVRSDGMKTRGDIHILLIGDPGAAKSQMLKYVADISPKGRYVVGKSASGTGLTATCVKDEFTGMWALEAGALVLSNGGLIAIDEMDKMEPADRSAMHSAMEQQEITINKASIQATLSTKTIILAAANPKFGRFDPFLSIHEQIDLPDTLLSRFDLIFAIRDVPDKDADIKLSRHILTLHKDPKLLTPPICQDLLRKYISYSRNYCNPVLTDDALNHIQNFYVKIRNSNKNENDNTVSLTARQLEALIRLSEASARVRLSDTVDVSDAERAIDLLRFCLGQVGVDPETGQLDIDVLTTGVSNKKRSTMITLLNKITDMAKESSDKLVCVEDLISTMEPIMERYKVDELIDKLKRDGELFEPRQGYIRHV